MPDLPLQDDGLHDVKFWKDSTFRKLGKYFKLQPDPPIETLDYVRDPTNEDNWEGVHWCLARTLHQYQQQVEKGFLTQRDMDRQIVTWKAAMDELTRVPIAWEDASDSLMHYDLMRRGGGALVRNPATGEWEPFA